MLKQHSRKIDTFAAGQGMQIAFLSHVFSIINIYDIMILECSKD